MKPRYRINLDGSTSLLACSYEHALGLMTDTSQWSPRIREARFMLTLAALDLWSHQLDAQHTGYARRNWINGLYGSVRRYCDLHGLRYDVVSKALRDRPHAARAAGLVREARLLLGLPVQEPSAAGLKLAKHAAARRHSATVEARP